MISIVEKALIDPQSVTVRVRASVEYIPLSSIHPPQRDTLCAMLLRT